MYEFPIEVSVTVAHAAMDSSPEEEDISLRYAGYNEVHSINHPQLRFISTHYKSLWKGLDDHPKLGRKLTIYHEFRQHQGPPPPRQPNARAEPVVAGLFCMGLKGQVTPGMLWVLPQEPIMIWKWVGHHTLLIMCFTMYHIIPYNTI